MAEKIKQPAAKDTTGCFLGFFCLATLYPKISAQKGLREACFGYFYDKNIKYYSA